MNKGTVMWPCIVRAQQIVVQKIKRIGSFTMALQYKDPALPKLWHRSQPWRSFDPWPGNFHMSGVQQKKKKKKKEKRKEENYEDGNNIYTVLHITSIINKDLL